jgi:hypothetical protein
MTRTTLAVMAAATLAASTTGPAFTASPAHASGKPLPAKASIRVSPGDASVGQGIRVNATGWPTGILEVSLCGNAARRGSQDCAVAQARTIAVTSSGRGSTVLPVVKPPVACTCVVRAVHRAANLVAAVPMRMRGARHATAPVGSASTPVRQLRVMSAVMLEPSGRAWYSDWRAWTGTRVERVFRITVRNPGSAPVREPAWSLWAGRDPWSGSVLRTPALGSFKPGQARTIDVPITLTGPVFGTYTVTGSIDGLDTPTTVSGHLTSWPWALPAFVAAIAMVLLAGSGRQPRLRRRRRTIAVTNNSAAAMHTPTKERN